MGGPPESHHLTKEISIIFTAAISGYLITSFHPDYLLLFENPVMQFSVALLIFNLGRSEAIPYNWLFLDALLLTGVLQLIERLTTWYYSEDGKMQAPEWTTRLRPKDLVAMAITILVGMMLLFRWKDYDFKVLELIA